MLVHNENKNIIIREKDTFPILKDKTKKKKKILNFQWYIPQIFKYVFITNYSFQLGMYLYIFFLLILLTSDTTCYCHDRPDTTRLINPVSAMDDIVSSHK